jgi:hypothetical protein
MTSLVLKIDGEAGKNGIDSLDLPETPASVHAKAAIRQLDKSFDVVSVELAC